MTTYAQLSLDIAGHSHRGDLTAAQISTFVALAEAKFARFLRVRQMAVAIAKSWIGEQVQP